MRLQHFFPAAQWENLRRLLADGGAYVETPLEYRHQDETYRSYFRTSIQPDGNVLNFLPDPGRFPGDPGWPAYYSAQAETHRLAVLECWQGLEALRLSVRYAAGLLGGLCGGLGLWLGSEEMVSALLQHLGWLLLSAGAGTLAFHFLLRPLLLRWLRAKLGGLFAGAGQ